MKLSQKLAALASTAMLLTNVLASGVASAQTASNTATAALVDGGKTMTAGSNATLSGPGLTVQTGASTISGTVTGIAISNTSGDGATWTASSTITQLGMAGSSIAKYGDAAANLAITGIYNPILAECTGAFTGAAAIPCGDIKFAVLTTTGSGASLIPDTLTVTAPDGSTQNTVTLSGGVGTYRGLTLTYTASSDWTITSASDIYGRVDIMPFTGITATPATLAATGGGASTTGVTLQSGTVYGGSSTTSSSRPDVVASSGAGYGSYTYDLGLSVVTHGYARSGSYSATLTLSIV